MAFQSTHSAVTGATSGATDPPPGPRGARACLPFIVTVLMQEVAMVLWKSKRWKAHGRLLRRDEAGYVFTSTDL